ncbi:hypothetical protein [Anabaena subtropica]|uniref:Uncharacterized protein n=1 Tax=Anabaena subtropica FACHB-260 TaxID=2692884 RepID=A0ABR8CP98_9NOST|nr:hypothetical protein [Anabaena subtropica]MBD2343620.1 hypothetical protein [Anabaena subtropica FACHB-260]
MSLCDWLRLRTSLQCVFVLQVVERLPEKVGAGSPRSSLIIEHICEPAPT